jgi:hypothetical protein
LQSTVSSAETYSPLPCCLLKYKYNTAFKHPVISLDFGLFNDFNCGSKGTLFLGMMNCKKNMDGSGLSGVLLQQRNQEKNGISQQVSGPD